MKQKDKVLKEYIEFKKLSITTKKSLEIVERYTKQFLNHSKKPLSKFGEKEIVDYFNWLDNNYAVSSSNDFKVMVKVFIKWYFEDWSSRFRNLDRLCKKKKVEPAYSEEDLLSMEDIEKLVKAELEPRWKAYWLILFYGGFRPKEVCELKWENITYQGEEAFISLYCTKNKKKFEKYIPANAVFYLRKLEHNNSQYVFPTKRKHKNTTKRKEKKIKLEDKPMTRSGVYQHLRDIAPSVFGKRKNPYILRHSIGTILYNKEGKKDSDVAQQLGHSPNMKKVYSHPTKKQIREKMKGLFIEGEELPPEKREELKEELKEQKEALEKLMKEFKLIKEALNPAAAKHLKNKKLIIRGEV